MKYPWRVTFPLCLLALWLAACTQEPLPAEVINPSVAIVKPSENAVEGPDVLVEVRASDRRGLAELRLRVNDDEPKPLEAKGRSQVSLKGLPEGQNTITFQAVNVDGRVTEVARRFGVDATPPVVELLEPSEGSVLAGQVRFLVRAADPLSNGVASGIGEVAFLLRGERVGLAQDVGPDPDREGFRRYALKVDTSNFPDGVAQVAAQAVDKVGNVGGAEVATNIVATREIQWLSPLPGVRLAGTVELRARVSPVEGVRAVEFFVEDGDGARTRLGEAVRDGEAYALSWSVLAVRPGTYSLVARYTDEAEVKAEAHLPVEVVTPFVIRTPVEGQEVGPGVNPPREIVPIEVVRNGALYGSLPEVTDVEVFINGGSAGLAPRVGGGGESFVFSWDTRRPVAPPEVSGAGGHNPDKSGERSIAARVRYASGEEDTLSVRVDFRASDVPTREIQWSSIALNTPFPGMRLAGAVELRAEVRPFEGVDRVEFFIEGDGGARGRIGEATLEEGAYVLSWQTWRVEPGDYILIARYTDEAGMQDEVGIPVRVATPFIIQTPLDLEEVGPGADREIVAIAVGLNGTLYGSLPEVTNVEVFINSGSAGYAAPIEGTSDVAYVFSWDTTVPVLPPANPLGNAGGHDPAKSGDRIITARVTHTFGEFLTPGVRVDFRPSPPDPDSDP